jgi:hypothetical protein
VPGSSRKTFGGHLNPVRPFQRALAARRAYRAGLVAYPAAWSMSWRSTARCAAAWSRSLA